MSLKSRQVGALAAAGIATLAMGASTAQAAKAQLAYQCKFPLISTQPLTLDVDINIPETYPSDTLTPEWAITTKATAGGTTAQGLNLVADLAKLTGVSDLEFAGKGTAAFARVIFPSGGGINTRVPIALDPYTLVRPLPDPLVLNANAKTPPLSFPEVGVHKIVLTDLNLNLRGTTVDGEAVEGLNTPPTDLDKKPYADVDGDPGTFNVPCKLTSASNQIATFTTTIDEEPVDDVAPSVPTASTAYTEADFTSSSINVRWNGSTDGGNPASGVKEYIIRYDGENGAAEVRVPAGTTNKLITGLGPETQYIFEISAVDNAGNESEPLSAELWTAGTGPIPNVKPTKPGKPAATSTETKVNLTWTASTDSDGTVKEYNVYQGATKVKTVTTASAEITGLTPGTAYSYTVEAVDDDNAVSDRSDATSISTKADTVAPGNPASLNATPAATSVALSWPAATDNIGVTGYEVYNGTTLVTTTANLNYTVTGLTAATKYTFKVVAKDAANNKSTGISKEATTTGGGGGVKYSYNLKGSTQLKTLTKGTLPLAGTIDADLNLGTGAFTADLVLNDTSGRLTALGFLPVTAKIGFVPSGKTTGTLKDFVLTTNSKVRIKVKEVKLFGAIPLAGGNNCQTKSLSDITLKSTQDEFNPLAGGPIAGTYKISDLNGCGGLNGLVSPLTAGGGNTINLNLLNK